MLGLVGDGFRIADAATGRVVRTLSRDGDTLFSAAYSADGSRVALGNDRLDLLALGVVPASAVMSVVVPAALAEIVVESGSAASYDRLLGNGWLQ